MSWWAWVLFGLAVFGAILAAVDILESSDDDWIFGWRKKGAAMKNAMETIGRLERRLGALQCELEGTLETVRNLREDAQGWRWVTVTQAAGMVGLSKSSIYSKIDSGELKCSEVCGRKFLDREELERMFQRGAGCLD